MRLFKQSALMLLMLSSQVISIALGAELSGGLIANLDFEQQTHRSADGERQIQKSALTLRPRLDASFTDSWSFRASLRLRADNEHELESIEPNQDARSAYNRRWFIGEKVEAELRDLYLDGRLGPALLRIGKQQIVWGQADGLRVLDVVNPFSFREFVIPDAEERRIPLWSVRSDIPIGSTNLQLLWIMDPTYDELPESTAAFAITTPLLIPRAIPGVNATIGTATRPVNTMNNSDAGLRWSATAGGWDLSANYLYHYYDDPVPAIEINGASVKVIPRYERTHLMGGTFANAFGSTTLRGEVGYSTDRWFITSNPQVSSRVFVSPELAWVIGIDNLSFSNTLLSAQYFQSTVLENDSGMTRDKHERQITALLQRKFANDSLTIRALGLYSINRRDSGVQAKLSWALGTHWAIAASVDSYNGDREGLFGEFRNASRWGLHLEWGS